MCAVSRVLDHSLQVPVIPTCCFHFTVIVSSSFEQRSSFSSLFSPAPQWLHERQERETWHPELINTTLSTDGVKTFTIYVKLTVQLCVVSY